DRKSTRLNPCNLVCRLLLEKKKLARGTQGDRVAPLARPGEVRARRVRHTARRRQIQPLGCRSRGGPGTAQKARGLQSPTPCAGGALLRAVGCGSAAAPAGER